MRGFLSCLLAVATACAGAQTAPQAAPAGGVVTIPEAGAEQALAANSFSNPFSKQPPAFVLIPHGEGAPTGDLWAWSDALGVHLWGEVHQQAPLAWPEEKSDLLAKDHVEVWLALTPDVPLPPVGWGNQFGETDLKSADDCRSQENTQTGSAAEGEAKCRAWYQRQIGYRAQLRRLFVRQWAISEPADGEAVAVEEYASGAWRALEENYWSDELPKALDPTERGEVTANISEIRPASRKTASGPTGANQPDGYQFFVVIPWNALPPSPSLDLKNLRLMVDVFGPAPAGKKTGAFATTAPNREWGNPATFNTVALATPRKFQLSPCGEPLKEANIYGDQMAAWFFPTQGKPGGAATLLANDLILTNPASGYLYDPGGVSPEADANEHFWKQIADGAWVCGPDLALERGGAVYRATPPKDSTASFILDKATLDVKTLADGWLLVRSGPSSSTLSPFGSGQCGACTVASLDFYAVSPAGKFAQALDLEPVLGGPPNGPDEADFAITPDWQQVTLYTEEETEDGSSSQWNSTTYCLEGHVYAKCGEAHNVQPPKPPNYPEFRGEEGP